MGTYIAVFLLMIAVAAIMSIGFIWGGKRLQGSCGGSKCRTCSDSANCVNKADGKE